MNRLSEAQIADLKARVDLGGLAQELGARLRRAGGKIVGSCPICGGGARATRFEVKGEAWVCAVCCDGGDAIRLVRQAIGLDFAGAIERLGGPRALSAEEARALEAKRLAREAKEKAEANAYRERERAACLQIWGAGHSAREGSLLRYLNGRGLMLPSSALVREAPAVGYFHGREEDERGRMAPVLLARTPAMLAQLLDNDGQPCGLHITHLRADWSGKAELHDPETGEILPAKKMRGSKQGAHIRLREPSATQLRLAHEDGRPVRMFMGEGIETTLAVARALYRAGRLDPLDIFWAAGDLGNLGGPHAGTLAHPSLTTPKGRPQRVPGPEPADGPAILIPPAVSVLLLLGDGDSEPVLTAQTLERGKRRYARPGLQIGIAMAPDGQDFGDLAKAMP
ncbi:CHC2 zinc finger domain-containing protein [Bosea sp. BK604]|uniref:DUF7146 domain-containing protein n=1 Tax=Bosea sp. BK604 TaxID=2512180 RepID=UPI0010D270FA|nr:CHC2 zinc finger domain-containing protein [Bosea sp. BK604]TCR69706.1 CHC2-type zinc finger protein [Bosea sp. BK604]